MKKTFAILLSVILLLSVITPFSVSAKSNSASRRQSKQFGYSYKQHSANDGRVIREYNKTERRPSKEYCKSLLKDLGLRNSFISEMSDEDIAKVGQAESIVSTVTYTRTDLNGNVEIIDEQTALEATASVYGAGDIVTDDGIADMPGAEMYHGHSEDTYMELCFMVYYMGNGLYHFTVDSTWLTTPLFRGWDSIGISSTHINIENSTRSGWFKYDTHHEASGLLNSFTNEYSLIVNFSYETSQANSNGFISNCTNGIWNGSGATFDLPNNSYYFDSETFYSESQTHSNFRAHFEFDGTIDLPATVVNFSALASYEHTTTKINITPSLEISSDGVNAVILSITTGHELYIADLDSSIQYTP